MLGTECNKKHKIGKARIEVSVLKTELTGKPLSIVCIHSEVTVLAIWRNGIQQSCFYVATVLQFPGNR